MFMPVPRGCGYAIVFSLYTVLNLPADVQHDQYRGAPRTNIVVHTLHVRGLCVCF